MSVQAISWVLEQSASTGKTRCVLISIANHVGPTGEGWVYVEQVLQEARCSEDTYQRAVRWAIEHDELTRDLNGGGALKAAGNRRPNSFRFVAMGPQPCSTQEQAPKSCGPQDADPSSRRMRTPKPVSPPQDADPEPLVTHEPSLEPSLLPVLAAKFVGTDRDDAFVAFYDAYPKHEAKGAARRAWRTAVLTKRNEPGMIVAAARLYAARRESEDSKFTPHPASWLNAERWLDEPERDRFTNPAGWAAIDNVLKAAQ